MKPRFSPSCDRFWVKMAKWQIFIKKQTRWQNDKTIIELGYHKKSLFVSVSQINYSVPQPLTNHDILLNLSLPCSRFLDVTQRSLRYCGVFSCLKLTPPTNICISRGCQFQAAKNATKTLKTTYEHLLSTLHSPFLPYINNWELKQWLRSDFGASANRTSLPCSPPALPY